MAPKVGLEPTTNRLTADCSTTELLRKNKIKCYFESVSNSWCCDEYILITYIIIANSDFFKTKI